MLGHLFKMKKTDDVPKYVNHTWDSEKKVFIPNPDHHGRKLEDYKRSKVISTSDVKFIKI